MAKVIIPIPRRDFDPSEAAVSWKVLTDLGHAVAFATPDGGQAEADPMMLTGRGLDPWGFIPGLNRIKMLGLVVRANRDARRAYQDMAASKAFQKPLQWQEVSVAEFDGLLLPGGHWARGMREYLESPVLQSLVAAFFAADKPVGAICHGVLLAARSRNAAGQSVLYGRKTVALTWALESAAESFGRIARFWDPLYYRTYPDRPSQPRGYMSVQQEVTRALASPADFIDVPQGAPDYRMKTSGLARDSMTDERPAWVVCDGNYVSARWPGDVPPLRSGLPGCWRRGKGVRPRAFRRDAAAARWFNAGLIRFRQKAGSSGLAGVCPHSRVKLTWFGGVWAMCDRFVRPGSNWLGAEHGGFNQ